MPLNAREVAAAAPLGLSAQEGPEREPASQTKENVDRATPFSPPTASVDATFIMPPVAAAGVHLAKIVLGIAAGAILVLMGYLVWMDYSIGENVAATYERVLNPSRIGSEFYTLDRLDHFAADLNAARANPGQTMSAEAAQRDQDVVKTIEALPSLTSTQKAQLDQCVPLPTDSSRNEKLGQCITVVDNIRQSALGASASTATGQIAAESAGKIQDQRQSLHNFWIQAAQLILLNLLLPLLTALFGYIFGTQQASGKAS